MNFEIEMLLKQLIKQVWDWKMWSTNQIERKQQNSHQFLCELQLKIEFSIKCTK